MPQGGEQRAAAAGQRAAAGVVRLPWAVGAAGALLSLLAALLLWRSLDLTAGYLTYTLDDPYIHMAMAKNLSQHGVWGVTRYAFTSSSSSPLWTLLLAGGFWLTGVQTAWPLILNGLCAGASLVLMGRWLAAERPGRRLRGAIILLAFVLFIPLAPLMLTGQEHLLHLFLVLLFAFAAARRLTGRATGALERAAFWALPPLLVLVRYESLFVIFPVTILLAARRRWLAAVGLGLLALAPLAIYGLISVHQGWAPIPNPIMSKANLPLGSAGQVVRILSGYTALRRLFVNAHLLLPVLAALAWLLHVPAREGAERSLAKPLLVIFLGAVALHLTFADLGWFYRYEAYLLGLALAGLGLGICELPPLAADGQGTAPRRRWRPAAAVLLGLLLLVGLGDRGLRATLETPRATANIYEQQIQVGRFLGRYYPGAAVAINDIGAANFLADIRALDLLGLADREVLFHLRAGTYGVDVIDRLARRNGARIAIVHPNWIRTPASWERVGSWTIRDNLVNGGDTVAFYALDGAAARMLLERLRAFAPRLPASVVQRGTYVDAG
jgi:hypothetical protein